MQKGKENNMTGKMETKNIVSTQETSRDIARLAYLNGDVTDRGSCTENVWHYEGNEEIDDHS